MRSLILAGVLPLVLPLAAAPVSAGHAAGETCHGQPATAVGTFGKKLKGTPGDDVLVSNGAQDVQADDGDDLICVTGRRSGFVAVVGGPGEDTIDSTAVSYGIEVLAGPGDDTVTTGAGPDIISEGNWQAPDGDDHISTGAGNDRIRNGDLEYPENADVVDAGPGNDDVVLAGVGWQADGGTGVNRLTPVEEDDAAQAEAWQVDAGAGTGTRNGASIFGFQDFTKFSLGAWPSGDDSVDFQGTDADESVLVGTYDSGTYRISLDLAGGDDYVEVGPELTGTLNGGEGQDSIRYGGRYTEGGDLDVDLIDGTATVTDYDGTARTSPFHGFERMIFAHYRSTTVRGSAHADEIWARATGCVNLRGGTGDDILGAKAKRSSDCGVHVLGGSGDDQLYGRSTDDVLLGGDGHDLADGGGGRDRCVAETRRHCRDG